MIKEFFFHNRLVF